MDNKLDTLKAYLADIKTSASEAGARASEVLNALRSSLIEDSDLSHDQLQCPNTTGERFHMHLFHMYNQMGWGRVS